MLESFELAESLACDSLALIDWPLTSVRLMNDSHYPWLILVPRRANISEIYQLDPADQQQLLQELNWAAKALLRAKPDKLNIAALGNKVPQLHVHVIARYKTDAAWPNPVWGQVSKPYALAEIEAVVSQYKRWLNDACA